MKSISKHRLPAFVLLWLFVLGCSDETPDAAKQKPVSVTVSEVTTIQLPHAYSFTGTVEGERRVKLGTKIMGEISYLPVEEGTPVHSGQVLAQIKSDDLSAKQSQVEANLAEAEAALKNAETNFNRLIALYEKDSASKKELDDAETAYQMASARVDGVRQMALEVKDLLGYATIVSPINGYVVEKLSEQGDVAVPGVPVLVVEDLRTVRVVTSVAESEIHLFRINDVVDVQVDAFPDQKISGIVDRINPGGNPASRQFEVSVRIAPAPAFMKSGMYARVLLEKGTRKVVAVPSDYLVTRGQLQGVFTVSLHDQAMLRWLRIGNRFGEQVEVLAGLAEGERVIAPASGIRDGQKVTIIQ